MSAEEALRLAGGLSEDMEDLYALKQLLFESNLGPTIYYLETIEGAFQRPSFLLKIVDVNRQTYNDYMDWANVEMMVTFFAEDMFQAYVMSSGLIKLLTGNGIGAKDMILPRYDFSVNPPTKISVSGAGDDNTVEFPSKMGARVLANTVSGTPFSTPDNKWDAPITFTLRSPRIAKRPDLPIIQDLAAEVRQPPYNPQPESLEVSTSTSGDVELDI